MQLRGAEPRGPGDHREGPGGENASWAGPDPAGGSGTAQLPGPFSKRHPAPALRADPLGCGPAVTSNSGWTGRRPRLGGPSLARAQLPAETPPRGQWKQFTQTQGDSISDAQATPSQSPFHPRVPSKAQIAPSPGTHPPWQLTPSGPSLSAPGPTGRVRHGGSAAAQVRGLSQTAGA